MGSDVVLLDRYFDLRHVTCDALAAGAFFGMMSVFADRSLQTCTVGLCMASETKCIALPNQVRFVLIAMNLVTIKTPKLTMIHVALNEVVSLHSILVCR